MAEPGGVSPGPDVYTIGHGNASAEEVIALLRQHQITILLDVRSSPYSHYATQFNREPFAAAVEAAGIRYVYAGEHLGGRPKDPSLYKGGTPPEGRAVEITDVDYPAMAEQPVFKKAIARLLEIAAKGPVALMCSEEDPLHCHRHHLIAQALIQRGAIVWHIRRDGRVQPAREEPRQLQLF